MTRRRQRAAWQEIGVGVAVTVAVLVVAAVGGLDWLELQTLDLRFRYANATPQDPRILSIDIDDGSLETVGRWPWPRDVQAGLISLLAELGARAILYDITLSEPEYPRLILPRQADIVADPAALDLADRATVLPDDELRTALLGAGMVYLAFHYTPGGTGSGGTGVPSADWDGQDARTAHDHTADRVRAWLDAEPVRWSRSPQQLFPPLLEALFPNDPGRAESVAQALRTELSLAATTRGSFVPLAQVYTATQLVPAITPVYYPLARAAERCGFVVFAPEHGVVRRVPPMVEYQGHVLPQLAFALACDTLGVEPSGVTAKPGQLELRSAALPRPLCIQLDRDGQAIIPWVAERDWTREFGPRIPANALWQVYDRRLSIAHNEELIAGALDSLLAAGLLPDQRQYADDLHQQVRLQEELRRARYRDDAAAVQRYTAGLAEYRRLLADAEPTLRAAVAQSPGTSPELQVLQHALAANDAYRLEIDNVLSRLRDRIAGRLCLIGYTASSLADMVPIPTHQRAPGVLAHANLLNGLLTGRSVGWAPMWLNVLIAAALGLAATVTTVGRGPRQAALLMLALLVVFVALAGWLAFYGRLYWIALTPGVIAAAASYGFVLLYRYMFLERESRQIAMALSQYTSPTLARKMAEDAELCRRAETREVTAVFTDLAGFTPLSERIGAERTQRLLNTCLGHLSDVIIRYEGMINKFIGDGIFAFWNPVIYPQPDHARRACQTAIELQASLRDLIAEQQHRGGDEAFGELVLRIGIATGNAVVGPCGSEQKFDYTCIGDSVNVAARLESANKFYGTRVLISGPTRTQAGDGFAFRPLGGVQVKGKTQAVPVFELLGRTGDVPPDLLRYADHFGEAVTAFQQRDWAQALQLFESHVQLRPDDLAARHYAEAVRHFTLTPPRADWNGALELMEK